MAQTFKQRAWYLRNRERILLERKDPAAKAHRLEVECARRLSGKPRVPRIDPVKALARRKAYRSRIKQLALDAYGGAVCACCGEVNIHFLTLDHVNNDGYIYRKMQRGRFNHYSELRKLGYPRDPLLQVLCYNCNNGKRVNGGICPHKDLT